MDGTAPHFVFLRCLNTSDVFCYSCVSGVLTWVSRAGCIYGLKMASQMSGRGEWGLDQADRMGSQLLRSPKWSIKVEPFFSNHCVR